MSAAAPASSCRVAICDDVQGFRAVVGLMLDVEDGIEVVGQAANGREAIDLVSSTAVDVLLLDVAMPIMDGLEALPHIVRASPATSVVMLTGFGTAAVRARALAAGASEYLEKGLAPDALVRAVRDACASSSPS